MINVQCLQRKRAPGEMLESANFPLYKLVNVHKSGQRLHGQQAKNKVGEFMLAKKYIKIQTFSPLTEQKHEPKKKQ